MAFDAAAYFDSLDMFGIRLGLDATLELAEIAGNPERELKFIHIAGTNGKGSVASMLERALHNCNFKTGLYTSPHLISIRERFRIDGKAVDPETFNRTAELLAARCQGKRFSYFEFATVLAMVLFKEAGCDFVIWETGMGGRLDATNIVMPAATIITNIALDHCGHLGNTTAEIAGEKAGIIKAGVPLFYGKLPPDALQVISNKAKEVNAPVFPVRAGVPDKYRMADGVQIFEYDGNEIRLSLPGRMQRENFRIVFETLTFLSQQYDFPLAKALEAMSQVHHPARFQHIGSRIILDGGHNPDGIGALVSAVKELYPDEKFTVVYTAFADKDAPPCVELLSQVADNFIFTGLNTDGRATFDTGLLAQCADRSGIPHTSQADPAKAVDMALQGNLRVIISGSLYLAGFMLEHLCSLKVAENI